MINDSRSGNLPSPGLIVTTGESLNDADMLKPVNRLLKFTTHGQPFFWNTIRCLDRWLLRIQRTILKLSLDCVLILSVLLARVGRGLMTVSHWPCWKAPALLEPITSIWISISTCLLPTHTLTHFTPISQSRSVYARNPCQARIHRPADWWFSKATLSGIFETMPLI